MHLIDRYMPNHQFSEQHFINITASCNIVMQAILNYKPEDDAFFRSMIAIREMPTRIAAHLKRRSIRNEYFGIHDFFLLGRDGNSEITFGLIGKLWQPDYGKLLFDNTDSFVGFHEPGFAKLILNYRIDKISREKIRLSTETRVFCTDKKAVYCFFPYWCLIRPASGLIRRRILSAIKKTSEAHQKDRILTNASHP